MGRICKLCYAKENPKEKISLHKFPGKKQCIIRDLWMKACHFQNLEANDAYAYICSSHFEEKCFNNTRLLRRLHKNAVPSLNIPCPVPLVEYSCMRGTVPPNVNNKANDIIINIMTDLQHEILPDSWTFVEIARGISFVQLEDSYKNLEKTITRIICVFQNMNFEIRIEGFVCNEYFSTTEIRSYSDVVTLINEVSDIYLCREMHNSSCQSKGFFPSKLKPKSDLCFPCRSEHRKHIDRVKKRTIRAAIQKAKNKIRLSVVRNITRKYARLREKFTVVHDEMLNLRKRCAEQKQSILEKQIQNLPNNQQEAIKACLLAAKLDNLRSMRYSNSWVLECLLMRIKSRKMYLHLLNHRILQVPTLQMLNKSIKSLKPSYGFQPEIFDMLKTKVSNMNPEETRGVLVFDEIKISEAVVFDSKSFLFNGFVNLGEYTPEEQKSTRGDHALVFMFQPFRGGWVQSLAAFLTKACADGKTLHHLVIECVILCENAGLQIDVVVADGASWNRKMWTMFGLTGTQTNCEHPYLEEKAGSSGRRMWFASDPTHLWKSLRNFVIKQNEIWTPDGIVKKAHLEALLKIDEGKRYFGLRVAHKLTRDHINPQYFQKMNVRLVLQLFSEDVAMALEVYKNSENPPRELEDCQPTVNFIRRIYKVIAAMSSRTPKNALTFDSESYKIIVDFLEYLENWHDESQLKTYHFMSPNTYVGLQVSLKSAIEVMTFLNEECGYSYLMTSRLTQDVLEGFFGMIRGACGSADHPDSNMFICVFRLLAFYSLVKPPKGSNVEGIDIFQTLLSLDDVKLSSNGAAWNSIVDTLIKRGDRYQGLPDCFYQHDYEVQEPNKYAQAYFAGFVAHKIEKWTTCEDCITTVLKSDTSHPRDAMIKTATKGNLKFPSDKLFELTAAMERSILMAVGTRELNCHTFLQIGHHLLAETVTFVGCTEHSEEITKKIINYYMVTRARLLAKSYDQAHNKNRLEEQRARKNSKLVAIKNTTH